MNALDGKEGTLPRVSVIMPAYNQAQYLDESIQSVLGQTFGDFEFIINNNGSTDDTANVLSRYSDDRIILFGNEENAGSYWGVEQCVKKARGEFFAFIGSDDVWEPEKLEVQLKYLNSHKECGAVFTETDVIDSKGNVQDWTPFLASNSYDRFQWLKYFYFHSNCVCWSSSLVRKECKLKPSNSNSRFKQLGDWYQWIILLGKWDIGIIKGILTHYRQHGENESAKNSEELHRRSSVEEYWILDLYYKKKLEELLKIFPELSKYRDVISEKNKTIFLAMISIENYRTNYNYLVRKALAVNKLFELCADEDLFSELILKKTFMLADFHKITGFGLYNRGNMESWKNEEGIKSIEALLERLTTGGGKNYLADIIKKDDINEYLEKRVGIKFAISFLISKIWKKLKKLRMQYFLNS
jgi:glycosyltransferase involved in cell wall biosynthesis